MHFVLNFRVHRQCSVQLQPLQSFLRQRPIRSAAGKDLPQAWQVPCPGCCVSASPALSSSSSCSGASNWAAIAGRRC